MSPYGFLSALAVWRDLSQRAPKMTLSDSALSLFSLIIVWHLITPSCYVALSYILARHGRNLFLSSVISFFCSSFSYLGFKIFLTKWEANAFLIPAKGFSGAASAAVFGLIAPIRPFNPPKPLLFLSGSVVNGWKLSADGSCVFAY